MHHACAGAAAREAGVFEEREVRPRRPRLVGVEQVVDGRVVLVDGPLDHPQAEDADVELDVGRRVARDGGDVVDALELHRPTDDTPSTTRSQKRSTSSSSATRAFAGRALRKSTTVAPRVQRPSSSTATYASVQAMTSGSATQRDGARVVDGRRREAVDGGVGAGEEVEPAGHGVADRAAHAREPLHHRGRGERLVREVEADHREGDAGGEHAVDGLRIDPRVELGGGRDVPRSVEPPIHTISRSEPASPGDASSATATLVSGPVAIRVRGAAASATARSGRRRGGGRGRTAGSGSSAPSSPLSPWISGAVTSAPPPSGASAPAASGMAGAPARVSTRRALSVTRSSEPLPPTVVTARRSMRGAAQREEERDRVVVPGVAVVQARDRGARHGGDGGMAASGAARR